VRACRGVTVPRRRTVRVTECGCARRGVRAAAAAAACVRACVMDTVHWPAARGVFACECACAGAAACVPRACVRA
jgi:hypothetical protein